jgi:hypothetical protein
MKMTPIINSVAFLGRGRERRVDLGSNNRGNGG